MQSPGDVRAAQIGNKAANLLELQRFVQRAGLSHSVRVPALHTLPHAALWQRLSESSQFKTAWRQFVAAQPPHALELTEAAQGHLAELRAMIPGLLQKSFEQRASRRLATWLQARRTAPLMVRSSGQEDGEGVANAGGNTSVSNVISGDGAVARAVGTVVASYFGDKSMQQRLLAGDAVTQPPCVAVLIQEMVGEKRGGSIPVSGVMFTEEPEGPTHGVAHIQATLGHNEAVVSSGLPCDSYYVDAQQQQCVVRPKMQRLAPRLQGPGLEPVDNPPALRFARALSPVTVRRLRRLGCAIAAHYGRPMDVEWTYDPSTHVIALLQARPVVTPPRPVPSHVPTSVTEGTACLAGSVVGCGGGTVRCIEQANQVVTATDLSTALQLYLSHPTRRVVQAVVVEGHAEATSHEAITLRGAGVPVLQVDDLAAAETLLASGEPVLLDAGRGLLIPAQSLLEDRPADVPAETYLRQNGAIAPGWSKHPLPAQRSVFAGAVPDSLEPLWNDLRARAAQCPPVQPAPGPNRLAQLLGALQDGPAATRPAALWEILQVAAKLTSRLSQSHALAPRAQALLRAVAGQIAPIMQAPNPLSFLYAVNWLRALLLQPNDAHVVDSDSYGTLLAEWRALRRRPSFAALPHTAQLAYHRVAERALRPDIAAAWESFVLGLPSPESDGGAAHGRLMQLLLGLQELKITDVWLHTAFASTHPQHATPVQCLAALEHELQGAHTHEACRWARQQRRMLAGWRNRLGAWAQGADLWPEFAATVVPSCNGDFPHVEALFRSSGVVGQMALLAWLDDLVGVYDATIKSITGSQQDDCTKARRMHTLLGPFLDLLGNAARLSGLDRHGMQCYRGVQLVSLAQVCHEMISVDALQNPERATRELLPSANFNGAAAQLGNGVDASQHRPQTLEDLFTLAHQSLLNTQSALMANFGLRPEVLPERIAQLCTRLTGPNVEWSHSSTMRPTGIHYAYPELKVDFNAPLREHSLQVRITYDVRTPDAMRMRVRMTGGEEHHRAERSMLYAGLYGAGLGLRYAPGGGPRSRNKVAEWTWQVPASGPKSETFCKTIQPLLNHIVRTTFAEEGFRKVVQRVRQLAPDLNLRQLGSAFFYQHPWYNDHFAQEFRDHAALIDVIRATVQSPPHLLKVRSDVLNRMAESFEWFLRRPVLQNQWRDAVPREERQTIAKYFAGHGSVHLPVLATQM